MREPCQVQPFDDVVVMVLRRPKPFTKTGLVRTYKDGDNVSKVDPRKIIGEVVEVGPGRIVGMPRAEDDLEEWKRERSDLAKEPIRAPMRVKKGDFVIFLRSVEVQPDGPDGETYFLCSNTDIVAKLVGFEPFTKEEEEAYERNLEKERMAAGTRQYLGHAARDVGPGPLIVPNAMETDAVLAKIDDPEPG